MQMFVSYAILKLSDRKPVADWKYRPSVYLGMDLFACTSKTNAADGVELFSNPHCDIRQRDIICSHARRGRHILVEIFAWNYIGTITSRLVPRYVRFYLSQGQPCLTLVFYRRIRSLPRCSCRPKRQPIGRILYSHQCRRSRRRKSHRVIF